MNEVDFPLFVLVAAIVGTIGGLVISELLDTYWRRDD